MSHSYEKTYTNRNNYLNKKRFQESNHFNYKPYKPNYYYNKNRNNFYKNTNKNYYCNRYSNNGGKKEYKKPVNINFAEGVRNISNCEMLSPQSTCLSLNENIEENSLRSFSELTNFTSPYKPHYQQKESQEQICYHKEYRDDVRSPNGHDEEEKKDMEKKQNTIEICEKTDENFIVYPENILDFNCNAKFTTKNCDFPKKCNANPENNSIKVDSCYLLSKIPNWRLVSKFVPISSLKAENFQKILDFSEKEQKHPREPPENEKKTHLVYSENYEKIVEDLLEENRNKKKEIKKDILNIQSIIGNFHYDALPIKNKIKQHKFEIDRLKIRSEELEKVIDAK